MTRHSMLMAILPAAMSIAVGCARPPDPEKYGVTDYAQTDPTMDSVLVGVAGTQSQCIPLCLSETTCEVYFERLASPGEFSTIPACEDITGVSVDDPLCHDIDADELSDECRDAGSNAEFSVVRLRSDSLPDDAAITVLCPLAQDPEPPCSHL